MLLLYGIEIIFMPTQPFEAFNIRYAYRSIHTFFNHFMVSDAVSHLESILRAATSFKLWRKGDPAQLLLYMEMLQELIAAALEIYYSQSTREDGIIQKGNETGILLQQHFVSNNGDCNTWNCFPRSLTLQQYYNPYKAIKKAAVYMTVQEWKILIRDCIEYALLKATITDVLTAYDILLIRLRLLQLIEACHLLDVRTNPKN
jgi:hypothetical protein